MEHLIVMKKRFSMFKVGLWLGKPEQVWRRFQAWWNSIIPSHISKRFFFMSLKILLKIFFWSLDLDFFIFCPWENLCQTFYEFLQKFYWMREQEKRTTTNCEKLQTCLSWINWHRWIKNWERYGPMELRLQI